MRINVKQPMLDYEGNPLLANRTNADGTPVLDEKNQPVQGPEELAPSDWPPRPPVAPGDDPMSCDLMWKLGDRNGLGVGEGDVDPCCSELVDGFGDDPSGSAPDVVVAAEIPVGLAGGQNLPDRGQEAAL